MQYTNVLEFQSVTKKIKQSVIVNKISFSVKKGEIFGLIGPNGAGKTTLLKLALSLTECTSGRVVVFGKYGKGNRISNMERMGSIIETPSFYNFFSGYENLLYFSRLHSGITKKHVKEVLELVGLDGVSRKPFKKYSLGMKQRLGIANALLHNPEILILDEPTNALDPMAVIEFRKLIKRLNVETQLTILISSHNLSEVEEICNRYAILSKGIIKSINSLDKLDNESILLSIQLDNLVQAKDDLWKLEEVKKVKLLEESNEVEILINRNSYSKVLNFLLSKRHTIHSISEGKTIEKHYYETLKQEGKDDQSYLG